MECRAYALCLDSQSGGHLGQDRKVPSAAGGNLSRLHKTEKTAKDSRMNVMYIYLCDRTLAEENLLALAKAFGGIREISMLVKHLDSLGMPPARSRKISTKKSRKIISKVTISFSGGEGEDSA